MSHLPYYSKVLHHRLLLPASIVRIIKWLEYGTVSFLKAGQAGELLTIAHHDKHDLSTPWVP